MHRLLLVASLIVTSSTATACGSTHAVAPAPTDPSADAPTPDESAPGLRLPSDVRPTHYALELAIDPSLARFSGRAVIDVTLPREQRVIHLHGKGLAVSAATLEVEGEVLEASWAVVDEERGLASLRLPRAVGPGAVQVRIEYDAPFDASLEGLYAVEQAGERYAFTQFEPLAARKVFPCFDEPSFKTPFDVTLTVQEGHAAIANAPELASAPSGEGSRRVRFATTEPLPTYLVAFAVGPLDVVEAPAIAPSDVRERPVPLRGVAPRGQGARLAYALEHTPAIFASLERYFGIPYPYAKLDLIAVPDFGAGAMENAGAITFRDALLLMSDDSPIRQRRGFAYVMAHELAHQWFGNLVTMAWWDDLWLNEAFATWMETRTIADTFPEHAPQISEMLTVLRALDADRLASARQIRQPIETEHDIHNAFDGITYSKGNGVLAMFERWLTPDVFQRGVQRYLGEHRGGNATAEDLLRALSAEAGRDVSAAFTSFLSQPGAPLVEATPSCTDGRGRVTLRQSRYRPRGSRAEAARTWQIPVCVRYAAGGEVHRACSLLSEVEGAVALTEGCPDWVMPNADGVGYYRFSMPADALEALRTRGTAALSAREQVALADSIEASFAAGQLGYADALEALAPLAASEERAVAQAPMRLVELAMDHVLDDEGDARARRYAARLYREQARRLGWQPRPSDDPETQLLRAEVLRFLAQVAEDASVRREAARRGRAYLRLGRDGQSGDGPSRDGENDGTVDRNAVSPDLTELAVTVAIQEGGAEAFDHALALLTSSTDASVRAQLLRGLSAAREPELRARALALVLDPRLRVNETFIPLMAQMRDPDGTEGAWAWLGAHYDEVAARMGTGYAGYLPYTATAFCSLERAMEARAFFATRVGATDGGPRNLESAVESIELCAARVEHARESAEAFFAR